MVTNNDKQNDSPKQKIDNNYSLVKTLIQSGVNINIKNSGMNYL